MSQSRISPILRNDGAFTAKSNQLFLDLRDPECGVSKVAFCKSLKANVVAKVFFGLKMHVFGQKMRKL